MCFDRVETTPDSTAWVQPDGGFIDTGETTGRDMGPDNTSVDETTGAPVRANGGFNVGGCNTI